MRQGRDTQLILFFIFLGIGLRFVWGGDIEYKFDEAQMFKIALGTDWPLLGIASSEGLRNPGMSTWVFIALTRIFSIETPIGLARGVQALNALALGAAALLGFRLVQRSLDAGRAWLWGIAIAAVNPIELILHRKIWAQSVLPIFATAFCAAWIGRARALPAFAWGLFGAALGQIHMAGFFFAAGVALWTCAFGRARAQTQWGYWLAGLFVGALPLLPWLHHVYEHWHSSASIGSLHPIRLLLFKHWIFWAANVSGLTTHYSLGSHFWDFLCGPVVAGIPTYGVALAHAGLVMVTLRVLLQTFYGIVRKPRELRNFFGPDRDPIRFLVHSAFWGYGLIITASMVAIHPHYHLVAFPLPFVGWAWVLTHVSRGRELWLPVFCGLLAFISISLLGYIHVHKGAPNGDFGVTFSRQFGMAD